MAISTCQNNNVFWTTYTGKFWLLVLVCTLVYLGSDCINSGNAECDFFLAYKHSENLMGINIQQNTFLFLKSNIFENYV